ncbi:hypothetical protein MHK_007533 [Candidatus Magnetomorum sp. HK-1]|nr:hypothetical protein MHK_007533 [Candidatus Magnetomorum sp. HK-1]
MIQATINIDNSDMSFLNKSRSNGFKDKINLIKTALTYLKQKFGKTNLSEFLNISLPNRYLKILKETYQRLMILKRK